MYENTDTITALQLFETGLTKGAIDNMAMNAVESVLEQGNVLQVAEALSAMEEFVKRVKSDGRFTDYVREEAGKEKGGYESVSGAKIEVCEVGTSYEFENCNDAELAMLEQKLLSAKNSVDARKKFLKTVPKEGILVTDPATGETGMIYPPNKTSTSSYKITLAK